jgi:hypothetical protein
VQSYCAASSIRLYVARTSVQSTECSITLVNDFVIGYVFTMLFTIILAHNSYSLKTVYHKIVNCFTLVAAFYFLSLDSIKRQYEAGSVAHTCNPNYSGGSDQEDGGSNPAWTNSL